MTEMGACVSLQIILEVTPTEFELFAFRFARLGSTLAITGSINLAGKLLRVNCIDGDLNLFVCVKVGEDLLSSSGAKVCLRVMRLILYRSKALASKMETYHRRAC